MLLIILEVDNRLSKIKIAKHYSSLLMILKY